VRKGAGFVPKRGGFGGFCGAKRAGGAGNARFEPAVEGRPASTRGRRGRGSGGARKLEGKSKRTAHGGEASFRLLGKGLHRGVSTEKKKHTQGGGLGHIRYLAGPRRKKS